MIELYEMLPPWPLLSAFLLASLLLAVTPGPGVFYVVACSLSQGWRAGLASVAGVAFGNLGNAIGAGIGLGALFAMSSTAFWVVKYLGAAYLLYLGLQAIVAARKPRRVASRTPSGRRMLRDGFMVALLNPKTALFFVAFLPQFMTEQHSAIAQSILLGVLFVLIAAITDCMYAALAGLAAAVLRQSDRATAFGNYASGGVFITLGLLTALGGARVKA